MAATAPLTGGTRPGSDEFHALMLTDPVLAAAWWSWYRDHPQTFFLHCLKIKDKAFNVVPFDIEHRDFRRIQTRLMATVREQWANEAIRVTELKPRQIGSTLFWMCIALWLAVVVVPNSQGIILADDDVKARGILQRLKDIIEQMPAWTRPKLDRDALEYLSFDGWIAPEAVPGRPEAKSWMLTESARNTKAGGRSQTWNIVLFSEAGFYGERAKDLFGGIRSSLTRHAPSMCILESTAFGYGGEFYEECRRARDKTSGYRFVFFPWFSVDEYRLLPLSAEAQSLLSATFDPEVWCRAVRGGNLELLDDDERELVTVHKCRAEQLLWRRWAIGALCSGDLAGTFHREFPATPREAFISSGTPVFNVKALEELSRQHVRPPLDVGDVIINEMGMPEWASNPRGRVRLWVHPVPGHEYLGGCDPCAGAENYVSPENHPGDNCAIEIIDRSAKREQVAEVAGPITPDEAGEIMLALCRYYNDCLAVVENNSGYGTPVIVAFKEAAYPGIYLGRVLDSRSDVQEFRYGWNTNAMTRPSMFTTARAVVRQKDFIPHSKELVEEFMTMEYQALPSGGLKPVARGTHKDDRATCMAMILHIDRVELGEPTDDRTEGPPQIKYDPRAPRAFVWVEENRRLAAPDLSHLR